MAKILRSVFTSMLATVLYTAGCIAEIPATLEHATHKHRKSVQRNVVQTSTPATQSAQHYQSQHEEFQTEAMRSSAQSAPVVETEEVVEEVKAE
jgi:hypothetical protein